MQDQAGGTGAVEQPPAEQGQLSRAHAALETGPALLRKGKLLALPAELLLRVAEFLSAEDLTVAAQTCTLLHAVASCEELWRRLFKARYCRQCSVAACDVRSEVAVRLC